MKKYKQYQTEINELEKRYLAHNLKFIVKKGLSLFKPRSKKTIWKWAEENIVLTDPLPGPFRIKNSPHLKEIFEAIQDPKVKTVTVMACAQSGKTLLQMIIWAYYVCEDPCNMLIMMPTDEFTKDFAEEKLEPIIENSRLLKARVLPAKKGSSEASRKTYKLYEGGWTKIVSAMKKGSTRMKTVRITITDEIDQHKPSVAVEGSVLDNLKTRSTAFKHQAFHLTTSTPRLEESSIVYKEFLSGSQEVYHIACPHCGSVQAFDDSQFECDQEKNLLGEVIEYKPETAYLLCKDCKHKFNEYERKEVLRDGFYIAKHPERTSHRSFTLPQFSSTIASMSRAMEMKIKAMNSIEQLESYYNNVLGLPFNKKAGESIDPLKLMDRKKKLVSFEADVIRIPNQVLMITAAVDVQRGKHLDPGRLELEFEGWGVGEENWHLHKIVLKGNPREADVWNKLDIALQHRFIREDGVEIFISRLFIDSGYATQNVYEYCANRYFQGVFAIKGSKNPQASVLPRTATVVNNEQTMLLELGVNEIKDIIYRRASIETPGPGYQWFSEDYCTSEYFKSYTAEHAVPKQHSSGFMYLHYEKKERDQANEDLDLAVYNYAGMKHALPDGHWDKLKNAADKIALEIANTKHNVATQIKETTAHKKVSTGRKKLRRL